METQGKCPCCWNGGPPYVWHKRSAPHIPQTKELLIAALKGFGTADERCLWQNLPKDELKHIYRKYVRGEPHPCDPTQGMGGLNKEPLAQRLAEHGVTPPGKVNKGAMMSLMRDHWMEQCALAESDNPTKPASPQSQEDPWDLIQPEDEMQHLVQDFCDASESLELALNAIWDKCSSKPSKVKDLINKVRAAHCCLVEASNQFIDSLD